MAGIVEPNDEQCHVYEDSDHRFFYDHFRFHDYPSISQIGRIIAQNSMNGKLYKLTVIAITSHLIALVIFAVAQPVVKSYRDLSNHILGAYVGELTEDSSNIVKLVEEQYNASSIFLSQIPYLLI